MQNPTELPTANMTSDQPRRAFDYDWFLELLGLAIVGTVLAGFAYASMLAMIDLTSNGIGIRKLSRGESLISVAFMGGLVGGSMAMSTSLFVAWCTSCFAPLSGFTGREVWLASLIGGWTGYIDSSVVCYFAGFSGGDLILAVALAVMAGQFGAGCFVWWFQRPTPGETIANAEIRFGLRQVFGATTALAIIAAIASLLRLDQQFFELGLMGLGLQAVMIGIGVTANAYWRRRRHSVQPVSREASP